MDRSGSIVLKEILRQPQIRSPVMNQVGLKESILVGAWYIWWQRREFVKGKYVADPTRTTFSIQALTCNFGRAHNSEPRQTVWTKPARNSYKLNVDAAFSENGTGGAGAVLRNDRGEAIAGAC